MTEQWRVGRRNEHNVYRQYGDEPRGMEHADHDASLGYFADPADARTAVEAVNAQAERVAYPAGRWRDVYVRVHGDIEVATTEQVTDTIRIDWSAPNAAGEAVIVGVEVVAATGVEVDGEPAPVPVPAAPDREALTAADRRAVADPAFRAVWSAVATSMALGQHPSEVADVAVAAMRGDAEAEDEDVAAARRDPTGAVARTRSKVMEAHAVVFAPEDDEAPLFRDELADAVMDIVGPMMAKSARMSLVDAREVGRLRQMHRLAISRLATALGVQLDPDDPDPVGTVEKAARALRSGGNDMVRVGLPSVAGPPTTTAELNERVWGRSASTATVADEWRDTLIVALAAATWLRRQLPPARPEDEAGLMVEMLRATVQDVAAGAGIPLPQQPAPEPPAAPLAVGDRVETAEQLESLPIGALIRSSSHAYPRHGAMRVETEGLSECWRITGVDGVLCAPEHDSLLPARVLDLGGES